MAINRILILIGKIEIERDKMRERERDREREREIKKREDDLDAEVIGWAVRGALGSVSWSFLRR